MQMMLIFAHVQKMPFFWDYHPQMYTLHCKSTFCLKGELYNALTGLNIALRARHKEPRVYGSLPFTVLNRPKRKKKISCKIFLVIF